MLRRARGGLELGERRRQGLGAGLELGGEPAGQRRVKVPLRPADPLERVEHRHQELAEPVEHGHAAPSAAASTEVVADVPQMR